MPPTATLTFTLPEEQEEFELTQQAAAYSIAIHQLDQQVLRPVLKYDAIPTELKVAIAEALKRDVDGEIEQVITETFEYIREQLYDIANDLKISVV